jgi:hypothetical protein
MDKAQKSSSSELLHTHPIAIGHTANYEYLYERFLDGEGYDLQYMQTKQTAHACTTYTQGRTLLIDIVWGICYNSE